MLPRFSAIFEKPYDKGPEAEVELKIEMWFQLDFSGSRTEIDMVGALESHTFFCAWLTDAWHPQGTDDLLAFLKGPAQWA